MPTVPDLVRSCKLNLDVRERTIAIDLCHPRCEDDRPNAIMVGLEDVRAADSILISYDFHRDGWSIKQASVFSWTGDEPRDSKWIEVAFILAWSQQIDESG